MNFIWSMDEFSIKLFNSGFICIVIIILLSLSCLNRCTSLFLRSACSKLIRVSVCKVCLLMQSYCNLHDMV